MNSVNFRKQLRKALRFRVDERVNKPVMQTDELLQSRIAADVLSKALNYSKLVRVQRPTSRNGKTYMTYKWVRPDKVKKTDKVVGNAALYEKWKKENTSDAAPTLKNPMANLKAKKAKGIISKKTKPAAPKPTDTDKKTQSTTGHPEAKPSQATKKPASKDTPGSKQPAKAKTPKPADTPSAPEAAPRSDLFNSDTLSLKLVTDIYKFAKLDPSDNLASDGSYKAACDSLEYIAQTNPTFGASSYMEGHVALTLQHLESVYGKDSIEAEKKKWAPIPTAGYFTPAVKVAAVKTWQNGGYKEIRSQSVHPNKADPPNYKYGKCLTDMVQNSGTKQTGTLYRGIHVTPAFLKGILQDGSFETKGLVSSTLDENSARQYALKTANNEVPVVLEIPESMKMKTLELGNESLLSTHGSFGVKNVTRDKDGVYHVTIKPAAEVHTGPIADAYTYAKFGVPMPADTPETEEPSTSGTAPSVGPEDYKALLEHYLGYKISHEPTTSVVRDHLNDVYADFGYNGVITFLTGFAESRWQNEKWLDRLSTTKTGYSPKLIEFIRQDWIAAGYSGIRNAEHQQISGTSTGYEIYNSVCNRVLNDVVEKDGEPQPGDLMRGIKGYGHAESYLQAEVGDCVDLGSISSFSTSTAVADNFASYGGIVLCLKQSAGVRCTFVEGLDEEEYLVQDQGFKVTKKEKKDSKTYLTIEPIPLPDVK